MTSASTPPQRTPQAQNDHFIASLYCFTLTLSTVKNKSLSKLTTLSYCSLMTVLHYFS